MIKVQSVLIPKKRFTYSRAKAWLRRNGFKFIKVHTTPHFYRFRQKHPNPYREYITKKLSNGVRLVIEI